VNFRFVYRSLSLYFFFILLLLLHLLGILPSQCYSATSDDDQPDKFFPLLKGLEKRVAFWEKVFTQFASHQAIIHDLNYPEIIYEVIDCGPYNYDPRKKARKIKAYQWKYSKLLKNLHYKRYNTAQLNRQEWVIYQKWKHVSGSRKFLWAAQNVHCQWGIKDRFKRGLIRAGRFQSWMKQVFEEEGLPQELIYLPHVESSFNYQAYSRLGAAGIWQFIPSTGRLFLRIDHLIDERLDPIASTRAAAKLLQRNYQSLGNWPLAITAYNYGLSGMLRAVKKTGSHNLVTIIKRYRSPAFGYASKNFYAEFLAALKIARNYKEYFGDLKSEPLLRYRTITLPDYVEINAIKQYFSLTEEELKTYNPSLLAPILESQAYLPKGFRLRIPWDKAYNLTQIYAQIPANKKHKRPKLPDKYLVRKGDTLISIAKKFGINLKHLRKINGLRNTSLIRVGQIIRLPPPQRRSSSRAISSPNARTKKPGPKKSRKESLKITGSQMASQKTSSKSLTLVNLRDMPIEVLDEKDPLFGWVTVEPEETLDLFATWCNVPVQQLREINGLRPKQPIKINQHLKVIFSQVRVEDFQKRRLEFHRAIQERFFSKYQVKKTVTHTIKKRENVWYLCNNIYQLPFWLIKQYNRDKDLNRLDTGDKIVIPVIKRVD
jgi:membrane-bound lytic murein transglycosylase D